MPITSGVSAMCQIPRPLCPSLDQISSSVTLAAFCSKNNGSMSKSVNLQEVYFKIHTFGPSIQNSGVRISIMYKD